MDNDLAVEVLSAIRRRPGLAPEEALSPAHILGILRREKFPLLSLDPYEHALQAVQRSSTGASSTPPSKGDTPLDPQDLSFLSSGTFNAALGEDTARYAQRHDEYVRVVQACARFDVPCLCFKSAGIVPSFPYAGDDLDILVPASRAEEARRVLFDLGYVDTPNAEEDLAWQFRRWEGSRAASPSIHLHARIGWGEGFMLEDEIWPRARPSPDDPWTWVPGREDVVLINVAQALIEKRALTLHSLVRIRYALHTGAIDWTYLDHVASQRGWRSCLHLGLLLVAQLEEQLFDSSTVPPDRRERYERTLRGSPWLGRYWNGIRGHPPTFPFKLSPAVSRALFFEKLWRDRHLPAAQKPVRALHAVAQVIQQKAGLRRQKSMLITLSGVDGSGKSSQAEALRGAFEASHVRSAIVWMRIGDTWAMRILRLARGRYEQHKGPAPQRTFNRTGWRLVLWVTLASAEYAVWLQHVRCRLWRGEVVIADRYLYDFEAELTIRLRRRMRLAWTLLSVLGWIAPKPKRAYLLRIAPELSKRRKPEPDYRGLDPADLQLRYDVLVPRYSLQVFDGSQQFEEVAGAIVHDTLTSYMESFRSSARKRFSARPRRPIQDVEREARADSSGLSHHH